MARPTNSDQDRFLLWAMIVLPILSLGAYIFDAFYYYQSLDHPGSTIYEGLLSTLLILFAYLQYCAPIESRKLLFLYHISLWVLIEVGHIGYFLAYVHSKQVFSSVIFVGWMLLDVLFTAGLIYCRVYKKLDYYIEVENKHLFHFISRLDVILAIFIPIFLNQDFTTTTRDNIAFFLFFDFFSEKYERFSGVWIKSCLYLFVTVVTASVASEWLYFSSKSSTFHYITDISELIAACLCYALIIMQFFTFHFKPHHLQDIVHRTTVISENSKSAASL